MFDDVRFPEDISYSARGGPVFFTSISMSKNGVEQRNINWQNGLAKYKIDNRPLSEDQMHKLISFFRARMGMAIGFRFKDWSDFNSTMEFTTNTDSLSSFQLTKIYTSGTRSYTRLITKPVEQSIKISLNDINISTFSLHDKGVIMFTQPLAIGSKIDVNFEFDVPVRFESDMLSINLHKRNSWSYSDILLAEVKI